MPNLEKYIRDHHDEFDSFEPEQGHFRRFEERLNAPSEQKPSVHARSRLLKIAALIIVLISVSVFVFDFATREIRERFAAGKNGSDMPVEIREALQYYDNQTKNQIVAIQKLTSNHEDAPALNASALKDIQSLDASTDELKKSLSGNPGNEQILDAIVRNQQMKESMLNTIITQLSQTKK